VLLVFLCCASALAGSANVILFIGDGMGPEQVHATGAFAYGVGGTLSFEQFPYDAEVTTRNATGGITDSAASATAMATGFKVNNGVLSLAIPGDGRPLTTLLERAQAEGRMTGLVTTTEITDATPAAFAAHEESRLNTVAIAENMLHETRPNILFGGGSSGLTPADAEAAGYTVVTTESELAALNTEAVSYVSGQFGPTDIPYIVDGRGALPGLVAMVEAALDILDNDPDGFFLMVEAGRIDDACHEHNIQKTVYEVMELSEAVARAQAWAEGRMDTVILVTADHETGGLRVVSENGVNQLPTVSWSTSYHTTTNVPLYAWTGWPALGSIGASGTVRGVVDNTDFVDILHATDPRRYAELPLKGTGWVFVCLLLIGAGVGACASTAIPALCRRRRISPRAATCHSRRAGQPPYN